MATTTITATECPKCGNKGKVVKPVTLRALLKDEFVGQVSDADYRFCHGQGCDVVYFGHDQTFTTAQLKVSVGVKEAAGERLLCYCFVHAIATIKEELRAKGRSDAVDDIRRRVKDAGCGCEVTNPSGSCCLGTVRSGIETAQAELNRTTPRGSKAETISQVGTVLSAIMASSCCWLPLVLLAFGVSGAGIAGALESYRTVFIVLTVSFLAAAFYFIYRPDKTATALAGCCAVGHGCCTPTPTDRSRLDMMALNKLMLWGVTLLAVAFLFFPKYVGFLAGGSGTGEATADDPLVRTTSFTVQGMSCEGCSANVETAIQDVPGVLRVKVDYEGKRVVVATEACCPVPSETILQALEQAGYRGEAVEDGQTHPGP